MPIYEYRCTACGDEFELLVLNSSPVAGCTSCGSSEIERLMSMSSVSSEQVRQRAIRDIRARNRAQRKDHAHEEFRRLESHARDHDD